MKYNENRSRPWRLIVALKKNHETATISNHKGNKKSLQICCPKFTPSTLMSNFVTSGRGVRLYRQTVSSDRCIDTHTHTNTDAHIKTKTEQTIKITKKFKFYENWSRCLTLNCVIDPQNGRYF